MQLRTGKTRGFLITGTNLELLRASCWPGAVWRKGEGVRMTETVASWKWLKEQDIEMSVGARKLMEEIKVRYIKSRVELKRAERRFKLTGETDIPVPLKTLPYAHQVRAFGFASSLPSSGCFADQGTGKTLIAIAVAGLRYLQGEVTRVVIVCPKNVKQVWPAQLREHANYPWSASINKNPPIVDGCQFWCISYDSVNGMMKSIKKWKPHLVIWDECHRLKNKDTSRYKANRDMSNRITYRLLLSGSPIGKCISESWSQYYLIDKSVFGTYSSFKSRYLRMGGYMSKVVVGYNNLYEFYDKFHSRSFRVTKDECLDLPPISYQNIYVESSKKASDQYNDFAEQLWMETKEGEVTSKGGAVTQMKLRQIAGGTVKTDDGVVSVINKDKLSALRDFLEDRLNDKTIIFFSFTHEISQADKLCKSMGLPTFILQGASKDRDTFESRFQGFSGPCVALINIQTGAEGLTLHSANYALYYSPSFSYIWYIQSRDRIYRIGQKRNVTIGFLIVPDTVDERVVEVLKSNGQLVKTTLEDNRTYTLENIMAKEVTGYTAANMAESLGIETRELRGHLRALDIEKPEAGWVWPKKGDAKDIEKQVTARIKELANKAQARGDAKGKEEPAKGKGKGKGKEEPEAPKGKGKKEKKDEAPAKPSKEKPEEAPKSKKKKPAKE